MSIAIKDRAYLTLDETKAWLKILSSETKYDDLVSRLINTACSRVESYIEAPVLAKEFVEYFDGNNSNVLIPSHFPIIEVTELKIDYNRAFGPGTEVSTENFLLRGSPAFNIADINANGVIGLDVAFRDDSNSSIDGRIFTGSGIQAIKLTYTSGLAEDAADLPDDLVTATLMLVDYLYIVKENRELGVGSKGVMGQSYSKKDLTESGMPIEVEAMLDEYKDWAFPTIPTPQRNNFKI